MRSRFSILFVVMLAIMALTAVLTDGGPGRLDPAEQLLADLEACGYVRHPIPDIAWELVRRGRVPPEAALYFSRSVNSDNIPFYDDFDSCDALSP